jgi:hypothetical protein
LEGRLHGMEESASLWVVQPVKKKAPVTPARARNRRKMAFMGRIKVR